MKRSTKEKLKIGVRQALLLLDQFVVAKRRPFISYDTLQHIFAEQEYERRKIYETLRYLKARGYILDVVAEKERYIEVTDKGKQRIRDFNFWLQPLQCPTRWDRKWRIIIFDIPIKHNKKRHSFREQLLIWGFVPIQRSVYAFPFDCRKEINALIEDLKLYGTVKYMIAEIIEGEEQIINHFLNESILTDTMIK